MKNVQLANDVIVGANAVVTKSFVEDNVTIAGIPASIISDVGYKGRTKPV